MFSLVAILAREQRSGMECVPGDEKQEGFSRIDGQYITIKCIMRAYNQAHGS